VGRRPADPDRRGFLTDGSGASEPEGGCPICRRGEPLDVLVDIGLVWVTAPADAPLPGYVAVVAKRHVTEPYDLDDDEGHAFWDAVMKVAERLRAATGARKMNYEIHGNTIPHLHLHLYPRFSDDPFQGRPIDGGSRSFHRTDAELDRLRGALASIEGG
jgi:diadenosine tetraphosphate (Ap4A) HIT family hydrolase